MVNFGRCEKNVSGFWVESSVVYVEFEGCLKVKYKGFQDGYGYVVIREIKW